MHLRDASQRGRPCVETGGACPCGCAEARTRSTFKTWPSLRPHLSAPPTRRAAAAVLVRLDRQVWGAPLIEDDLKIFGNYGYLFDNGLQWYAHNNYASKTVTGGFYFRNPNTRGAVFSGDGGTTLLVGDVLAATGRGTANCPTIAIVNNAPDPVAFGRVTENPNCFTFHQPFRGATGGLPGGFTPQFGADVYDVSLVTGVRGSRAAGSPGTRA